MIGVGSHVFDVFDFVRQWQFFRRTKIFVDAGSAREPRKTGFLRRGRRCIAMIYFRRSACSLINLHDQRQDRGVPFLLGSSTSRHNAPRLKTESANSIFDTHTRAHSRKKKIYDITLFLRPALVHIVSIGKNRFSTREKDRGFVALLASCHARADTQGRFPLRTKGTTATGTRCGAVSKDHVVGLR